MTDKTTIINIDLARDVKDDILFNVDTTVINSDIRSKIMSTPDGDLMRIVNTINSPKTIIGADVLDEDYLSENLIKSE